VRVYSRHIVALTPGTRLGIYQIIARIGAGGMGEVFRARDTKLNRDVALKVLPDVFAGDPDRLTRFTREAQTLASLNHPNIAHIHGMEEADDVHALVMELVEGDDLSQRLARGAIPLDEALPIARQIADGLEAAHEQGIIHRDLKPANVKVRADGTVKVLDFGLAKMLGASESGASGGLSLSPTLSLQGTFAGTILGTAAYMSPEQARGKPVDKRTDIWAFGCVLYEMLTGKQAFDAGDTISDAVAAILTREPDWNALPPSTPTSVRAVLRRCLEKDRKRRLADIADARLEMDDGTLALVEDRHHTTPKSRTRWPERAVWALVGIGMAMLAVGANRYFIRDAIDSRTIQFEMSVPEGWTLTPPTATFSSAPLAVSPDGRRVAIVARNADGKALLWVRALETLAAQPLTGTEGAASPFWSPDSRFLGFFADGKLKKIAASGGPVTVIGDAVSSRGGAWGRDGTIIFAASPSARAGLGNQVIQRISSSGGASAVVSTIAPGERYHLRPSFLPDGRHFLFRSMPQSAALTSGVELASLDVSSHQRLFHTHDTSPVLYAQGHVFFVRGDTLLAQSFDLRRLELAGEALPVAEQVQLDSTSVPLAAYSVSDEGVLVYRSGPSLRTSTLTWLDRTGKRLDQLGEAGPFTGARLSPDGRRLAVSLTDLALATDDLWVLEVASGLRTRLTFDAGDEGNPTWSPDGAQIAFSSSRSGHLDLYVKIVVAARGSGNPACGRLRQDAHDLVA
jgi:eukaryotic-like serine/threonine-protein kinase